MSFIVERAIPHETILGINNGTYQVYGGVVRKAAGTEGAGQIVRHLRFPNEEVMQAVGSFTGPLLQATIALGTANLAVSAIGFAVVVRQLKKLDKKVDEIKDELKKVSQLQNELKALFEIERSSKLVAVLENLEAGLQNCNENLTSNALHDINICEKYYRALVLRMLPDDFLENPEPLLPFYHTKELKICWDMYIVSGMARSNAWALMGKIEQATRVAKEIGDWHYIAFDKLSKPLRNPDADYVLRLSRKDRDLAREFVIRQKQISEAIEYSKNQYLLCSSYNINFSELTKMTEKNELLVIAPPPANS